jgi:hypothetical protein
VFVPFVPPVQNQQFFDQKIVDAEHGPLAFAVDRRGAFQLHAPQRVYFVGLAIESWPGWRFHPHLHPFRISRARTAVASSATMSVCVEKTAAAILRDFRNCS